MFEICTCFACFCFSPIDIFRTKAYFVKPKNDAYYYIAQKQLWPPIVLLELDANILRSKDYTVILFNINDNIFQVHTPYKLGVKK